MSKPSATADRLPIAARGVDLLRMIAVTGHLFVTQDEKMAAVTDGHAAIDKTLTPPGPGLTAIVLTEAGKAALANTPAAAAEKVAKILFDLDDDVERPSERAKRAARESKYPIETMGVGQSFHVPTTADMPDPVAAIASTLTAARLRHSVPAVNDDGSPKMETVEVTTYARDANGKRYKGEGGKLVIASKLPVERQVMTVTRNWEIWAANDTDRKGVGARIRRIS
jgi:hypothetical protein